MFSTRTFACLLTAAVASTACSSDTTTPSAGGSGGGGASGSGGSSTGGKGGGSGGTAGSGGKLGTGGAVDAGNTPVTFSGTVVVAVPGQLGKEQPLAGVSVCVIDATGAKDTSIPCVTTNAKGEYSIPALAPKQNLIVSFEKAGYGTQVIALDVGTADATRADLRMAANASGDAGTDAGAGQGFGWDPSVVQDPTKGFFNTFSVVSASQADAGTAAPGFDFAVGVSFAVTPKSGVGPFYVNADETWASGATSTAGGYGAWFLNLTPGTYTVTATSPTMTCSAIGGNGYGWAQADGSSKVPVLKGTNTQSIGFFCATPADAGAPN
jgi:Carboxypeptidase regulatory-like domain